MKHEKQTMKQKVIERVIENQMTSYLNEHNLFTRAHCGF